MIKTIKPNSWSHKFLTLIFTRREVEQGVNICDVPWRLLREGIPAVLDSAIAFLLCSILITWVVGLVLVLLSPWLQYNLFFANLSGFGYVITAGACIITMVISPLVYIGEGYPIIPRWLKKNRVDKEPDLLSIWWKSFKEKTCVKIVVGEDK